MIYAFEIIKNPIKDDEGKVTGFEELPAHYYEWRNRKNETDIEVSQKPGPLYSAVFDGLKFLRWEIEREVWLNTELRPERDRLLNETDLKYCNAEQWEKMSDTEKKQWSEYKQALRDLPETIDIKDQRWPEKP